MTTEIKFETPEKENKSQKIIIYILGFLVLALSVGFMFLYFKLGKIQEVQNGIVLEEVNKNVQSDNIANSQASPLISVGPNTGLTPSLIGKIKEVSDEKIKIALSVAFKDPQNPQGEIEKEIERANVGVVKKLIKNPSFNEEKARQIQEEMKKKYENNKNAIAGAIEEGDRLVNEEDLKPFTEEIIDWSSLKNGAQVSYQNDETDPSKMVLVILSELEVKN